MLRGAILILFAIRVTWTHPAEEIHLPDIAPTSPQAINNLQVAESQHQPRLIANAQANDLEKTIAEVQQLIKENPSYPKLTRGEIIDIIENLTRTDPEVAKKFNRNNGKKAIMVVMPYTPNGNEMEDLYTKPPVTHIIGNSSTTKKPDVKKEHQVKKKPFVEVENLPLADLFPNIQTNSPLEDAIPVVKPLPPPNKPLRRRRPELTTPASLTTTTTVSTTLSTTPERRTYKRRRTTTTTPVPHYYNHRYPDEDPPIFENKKIVPNSGLTVVNAPDLAVEEAPITKKPVPQKSRRRTTRKPIVEVINVPGDLRNVIKDLELGPNDLDLQKTHAVTTRSTAATFTTPPTPLSSTAIPDVSNVADTLTPEMKDLLMNFGLIPNPNEKIPEEKPKESYSVQPERVEIDPEAYVGFKPLPDTAPTSDDMEAFLASFGLGRSARKQKSASPSEPAEDGYNLDMIPESLRGVISDIGLKQKQDRRLRSDDVQKVIDKHVFNPEETNAATEDELKKLNKLLDVIRQLEKQQNGTSSMEDMKQADIDNIKELVNSLNNDKFVPLDEQSAPNPLNFDYGVSKNEVKRQENSSAPEEASKQESPSISDLEASFGGAKEVEPAATTLPPPATPKYNGFYTLVDWNTFLDIDNQKGRRVNLRFQPKVGDPKRFLSVSVP